MISSHAPYQLSAGLHLEESGVLLPWFHSLNQLAGLGGKPLPEKGKVSQLFWENERVFGLRVAVQAMAYGSGIYYLTYRSDSSFISAQEEYSFLLNALKERFGQPHESGSTEGYPWVRWRWNDVCLSLAIGERFLEYVALSVSRGVINNDTK